MMCSSLAVSNIPNEKQSITLVPVVRQFFSNTDKQWLSQLPAKRQVESGGTINANWKQAYLKKDFITDKKVFLGKE